MRLLFAALASAVVLCADAVAQDEASEAAEAGEADIRYWPYEADNQVFPRMPGAGIRPNRADSECDGRFVVMRVSVIRPESSMDAFMQAAADHEAWYRSVGVEDNEIVAAPVMLPSGPNGVFEPSATHVVSFHVNPPNGELAGYPEDEDEAAAVDAAYDAFVAGYRETSELIESATLCAPFGAGLD